MKELHLYISGVVHGVSFRYYTQSLAQKLGLRGWVKNLSDGRVEVLAQGPKEQLEKLLEWCREGPEAAQVSDMDISWREAGGEFSGFEIRY